jgi:ribonuclease P protein component
LTGGLPTGKSGKTAKRAHVLRQAAQFEAVLGSDFRLSSLNFVLRALENGAGGARLGIIAGKKAAPRAVDRNRAKRLIRETFRGASERLGPCDIAIQLRGDLRTADNSTLRAELQRLFESLIRRRPGARTADADTK